MSIVRISVDTFVRDFYEMSKQHYDEVPFHNHEREYNLDVDLYRALEEEGYVIVFAAYVEDVPVGYVAVVANPSLHHKGYVDAVVDSFFVLPEYRRLGIMKLLIEKCFQECMSCGLESVRIGINVNFPEAEGLVVALGMDKLETYYIKVLSEE